MRLIRDASIRVKLYFLTASSVLVALALTCASFALYDIFVLRQTHLRQIAVLAEILGANTAAALEFGDRQTAEELLSSLANEPSIDLAVLYDAEGRPFASFAKNSSLGEVPPVPPRLGRTFTQAGFLEVAQAIGKPSRLSQTHAPEALPPSRAPSCGVIFVRGNLDKIQHETVRHLAIAAVVLAAALAAAMGLSWGVQRVIVAPIHELVAAARRISRDNQFGHRVTKRGRDEHGVLCDAFNAMLDRIEATQRALQQAHDELERRVQERTAQLQRAMEEATAANKAKSDFLANMSHEIRTPMTAVLGYADLLVEEDRLSPVGVEHVDTIRRNGRHLLAVINDILDVSKIEAGKMTVERIDCSVCRTLVDVVSLWRGRAGEKGLTLEVEYRGRIPERIRTDPTRLHQILANLVGNAVKFTDRGGVRLVVSLRETSADGKPRLQFEVIDTGVGMTPEQLSKVFQAFTQADETMTRRYGGTGLGLTIAQGLAGLLGGEIRVASEPGRGSCFTATIETGPLDGVRMISGCREAMLCPEGAAPAPSIRVAGRVLLVEDGLDNQRLISFVLRRAGAEVTVAENGQQGLDAALAAWRSGEPFAVVLMDMQMPVLDGYQATTRLRQAGYDLPIVALTAHAMSHDRQKCLDAGCDDYLTKPIDKQSLLAKVGDYAQGAAAQPA